MKILSRRFFSVALLAIFATGASLRGDSCCTTNSTSCSSSSSDCDSDCSNSCTNCTSLLIGRSSHNNSAIFGWQPYSYIPDVCEFNTGFWIGYGYQSTFGSGNLANCIAGGASTPTSTSTTTTTTTSNCSSGSCSSSCANQIRFQGSQVANRLSTALIADNFGLSQLADTTLTLNPKIQSNNLHFQWYLGFDNWVEGLYLMFDLTFSNQKRSLFDAPSNCSTTCNTTSTTTTLNTTPFPVGYMSSTATTPTATATTLAQALSGTFTFGDMTTPWAFGAISSCSMSDNKVAGFSVNFGYNFWNCDDSHLGAFIRYTAPTGTNIQTGQKYGNNFFAPVIGNGHHHELGGGLHFHKQLWSNDCGDAITLFVDGYATHLFNTCQFRSFDFLNKGCWSRYMLLKQLTPANTTPQTYTYAGSLINAINFATRPVTSSFNVQGDAAARFIYKHDGFSMAIGYNIFGRSQEKLCLQSGTVCNAVNTNLSYGFKGCDGVAYYNYATTAATPGVIDAQETPFLNLSNATGSAATITNCGATTANAQAGTDNALTTLVTNTSVGVDWSNPYTGTGTAAGLQANAIPTNSSVNTSQVAVAYTSNPSVLVDTSMLDLNSGKSPRIVTSKGFIQFDYVWEDCCWSPYLGIGGEVEGGSKSCDIRQWGVWVRGGLGF